MYMLTRATPIGSRETMIMVSCTHKPTPTSTNICTHTQSHTPHMLTHIHSLTHAHVRTYIYLLTSALPIGSRKTMIIVACSASS